MPRFLSQHLSRDRFLAFNPFQADLSFDTTYERTLCVQANHFDTIVEFEFEFMNLNLLPKEVKELLVTLVQVKVKFRL